MVNILYPRPYFLYNIFYRYFDYVTYIPQYIGHAVSVWDNYIY